MEWHRSCAYDRQHLCLSHCWSLFEPCGLGQLISLRYGTLPIVRETGGLKDTVQAYNEFSGEGNGFSFTNYNAHDMLHTIRLALDVCRRRTLYNKLRKAAMSCDYSWQSSASKYLELYHQLAGDEISDGVNAAEANEEECFKASVV